MKKIQIIGTGCPKCIKLTENPKKAAEEAGVAYEIEKVTDINKMMELGQSQPWPQTLAVFSGETRTDASAVADYFKPLDAWLTQQNKGRQCGW